MKTGLVTGTIGLASFSLIEILFNLAHMEVLSFAG